MEKKDLKLGWNEIQWLICLIVFFYFYRYLKKKTKRYASIEDLPSNIYGIWLSGVVTHVQDGDGFKFFHIPWFNSDDECTSNCNLTIRLTGIDAPEMINYDYGKPGQPFSLESKNALRNLIMGKKIKIKLLRIDRYNRVLAMCFVGGWFSTINVNMKMIELGMASVYRGCDADYDNCKEDFLKLEAIAKDKKLGIWSQKKFVSPIKFKKKHWNSQLNFDNTNDWHRG